MSLYYIIGIAFLMVIIFLSGLSIGKRRVKKRREEDPYKEALTAIVEGDKELAIKKLREAISYDTENVDAYYRLGELYRDKERCDKALEIHLTLTARPGLAPQFLKKLYKAIALDYECMGEIPKAIHYIEKTIEIEPSDASLYSILLKLSISMKDWEKVENILKSFRKKIRDKYILSLMYTYLARLFVEQDIKQAERYLKNAEKSYKNRYIPLVKGEILFKKGQESRAIAEWKKFIKDAKKRRFMVYPLLENKLYEMGRYGDVIEIYENIWSKEKDAETGFPLASIYEKQGRSREAMNILKELSEKHVNALINLSFLLLERGDQEGAMEYLKRYLNITMNKYVCRVCGKEYSEPDLFCRNCGSWETILPA